MNEDGSYNGRYERVVPDKQITNFERRYAAMHDTGMMTKASTIKVVESATGHAETYIVQTARDEPGDTLFRGDSGREWVPPLCAAYKGDGDHLLTA